MFHQRSTYKREAVIGPSLGLGGSPVLEAKSADRVVFKQFFVLLYKWRSFFKSAAWLVGFSWDWILFDFNLIYLLTSLQLSVELPLTILSHQPLANCLCFCSDKMDLLQPGPNIMTRTVTWTMSQGLHAQKRTTSAWAEALTLWSSFWVSLHTLEIDIEGTGFVVANCDDLVVSHTGTLYEHHCSMGLGPLPHCIRWRT